MIFTYTIVSGHVAETEIDHVAVAMIAEITRLSYYVDAKMLREIGRNL